jgi:hypothetical protein
MESCNKELLKKLANLPTVMVEYNGKKRPCVDIALVLNTVRGKNFNELTFEEMDKELCYHLDLE